jgi:polysaccharide pyruvyl transferase WcaK-like protein
MNKIAIFNTKINSDNIGDEIIMEAVGRYLHELFPDGNFLQIPTKLQLNKHQLLEAKNAKFSFIGGTNLLCNNWLFRPQWLIGLRELSYVQSAILFGVGWRFYQPEIDFPTKLFLRKLLNKKHLHSVRDNYTLHRLKNIGIHNVINTTCPTMWQLTPDFCAKIPTKKADTALITVTAYRNAPEIDRKWLEIVVANYSKIYLFSQMSEDAAYVKNMNLEKEIEVLPQTLAAYDNLLASMDLDYIGTRLHGGIRALQHGRRSLIVEVDNRATEIAKDTNLPTVKRTDFEAVRSWIEHPKPTIINLPIAEINQWKAQFSPLHINHPAHKHHIMESGLYRHSDHAELTSDERVFSIVQE